MSANYIGWLRGVRTVVMQGGKKLKCNHEIQNNINNKLSSLQYNLQNNELYI